MSSSGVSDGETGSGPLQGVSFAQGNFSATLLPPMLDIPPPAPARKAEEVVTYSREVQTSALVQDEDSEEDTEEVVKRRVDEEVRKEVERLRLEEEQIREEEIQRREAEKQVPGTAPGNVDKSSPTRSRIEYSRVIRSTTFYLGVARLSRGR
jgi:hypothetical protein